MKDYRFAEIAYNAYCEKAGWKSLATGQPLPKFQQLPEAIKDAWERAAAAAVVSEVLG